jgi:hypothetical protein
LNHRIPGLTALIAVFSALALPALAAATRERQPSPLSGVTALDKPVTYTETKISLGELVQRVAAVTGVKLIAK